MNWIKLFRIYQWPKNVFVFGGIVFTSQLFEVTALFSSIWAFIIFCIASSLVYTFNDICDQKSDQLNPTKKHRPIAAGKISKRHAGIFVLVGSSTLLVGTFVIFPAVFPLLALYMLINLTYSLWLKHFAVLDILLVSSGFILRVLAGTEAIQVPASDWILLCTGALAVFLTTAKRIAEKKLVASESVSHRKYSSELLNQLLTISAGAAILTYGLYCSELNSGRPHTEISLMISLPFVVAGILYYLVLLHRNPESCAASMLDKWLVLIIFGWLISVWIAL
jgi:4-hydroxybenzoate polyprenyltransferase